MLISIDCGGGWVGQNLHEFDTINCSCMQLNDEDSHFRSKCRKVSRHPSLLSEGVPGWRVSNPSYDITTQLTQLTLGYLKTT